MMSEFLDPEFSIGWFNEETGNWDKEQPDLPAFMLESKSDDTGSD